MNDIVKSEYMKLCTRYRLLSVLCSTAGYLIWMPRGKYGWYGGAAVSAGMVTSCVIGTFLYRKTFFDRNNRVWLFLTFILELAAYGIFVSLSGGLSSPYLWSFFGCLFPMAAAGEYAFLMVLAAVWTVFCITAGGRLLNPFRGISRADINTVIGILIMFGGFYTLHKYILRQDECRRESEGLNHCLKKEKEATEQALHQITDLYDTVNIFTVAGQRQSMEELAKLVARSVAPKGCMILKFKTGERQEIDGISSSGLEEHTVQEILEQLEDREPGEDLREVTAGGRVFAVRPIGEGMFLSGFLILSSSYEEGGQELPFYQNVIDTVFKDMDIQKNLEDGVIKEEQRRIASEIHDTVIQKLFGISCSLSILEHSTEVLSEQELKERLQSIEKSTRLAMRELRETIYGMRFENDRDGSFEEKLKLYLREAERLSGASVSMDSEGDSSLLSAAQKTVVYRIVCEAVNNAVRHGKAGRIDTKISISEQGVGVTVKDNGAGFEPEKDSPKGTGVKNMYRMVSLMKGTCSVRSAVGKGTEVDVFLPR